METSIKVKDINIKYKTYYFFSDIVNIENSDPNNIKIQEKLYKDFFYLLYWTCDDQVICKKVQCKSFAPYFQIRE